MKNSIGLNEAHYQTRVAPQSSTPVGTLTGYAKCEANQPAEINISTELESISNRLGEAQQVAGIVADQLGGCIPSDPCSSINQAPADVLSKLQNIRYRLDLLLADLRRANHHI